MSIVDLNINNYILQLIVIVISLSIHEFAHAFTAVKLGDPTPKMQGRLTLNPVAHLDIYGFLMIALVGLGWGKPVEFDPGFFKNPRKYTSLVALAGPLSNICIALIVSVAIGVFGDSIYLYEPFIFKVLTNILFTNLVLAFFNLIPLFPLDGFNILSGILPLNLAISFEETRKYGIVVLIILMITGQVSKILSALTYGFLGFIGLLGFFI